jgi:DNA-binding protein HU-beta
MNKRQVCARIAKQLKLKPAQVVAIVDGFMKVSSLELSKGGKISLSGFGSFELALRKGRRGYDPHRGNQLSIPDMWVPKFRPSRELRELCNPKKP